MGKSYECPLWNKDSTNCPKLKCYKKAFSVFFESEWVFLDIDSSYGELTIRMILALPRDSSCC